MFNCNRTLLLSFFLSLILLNACGGGGGAGGSSGSSSSSNSLNTGTSLTYSASTASTWKARVEFDNINAHGTSTITPYESINAHKAYGYGLSGSGKQIMIMDSRFDVNSVEFADKTVTTYGTLATAAADGSGGYHGNFVAGIAAADYNENSNPSNLSVPSYSNPSGSVDTMMGVAHNADLFFADYTKTNGENNYGTAWKNATDTANTAVVQNNSWGIDVLIDTVKNYSTNNDKSLAYSAGLYYQNNGYTMTTVSNFQSYIDSLDDFQDHGVIVFALTNDTSFSNADMSAGLPEFFPKLKEAWITVGNVEITGSEGNQTYTRKGGICGDTASYCLVADGWEVFSVANLISGTSYVQGVSDSDQTTKKSGTSYSAPQISGSIAILAEAFPSSSAEILTDRLLATADNSFFTASANVTFSNGITHGYNTTYGHGIPDLYQALQPITTSRMGRSVLVGDSLKSSKTYSLERSLIETPKLFGETFKEKFKNHKGTFHDAMYGAFNYDFSKSFKPAEKETIKNKLDKHFKANEFKYISKSTGLKKNISMKVNNNSRNGFNDPEFMLTSYFDNNRGSFNSYNLPIELTTGFISKDANIVKKNFSDGFNIPFLSNNNSQNYSSGIFFDDLNETTISLFYSDAENGIRQNGGILKTNLFNSSLLLGHTNEEGGFLGTKSDGAFKKSETTPTNFISHNFEKNINDKLNLSSLLSLGYTQINGFNENLIEDMSDLYSSSWGINLAYDLDSKDLISLSLSQPHRIEKGFAKIKIPKLHSKEEILNFESSNIDIEPSGREINFSLRYDKELSKNTNFSIENIITNNSMHNTENNLDNSLFISYSSIF